MLSAPTKDTVEILIGEKSCRGCQLCVDICPTKVFDYDEKEQKAVVKRPEDCIQCMSCQYLCPSNCITQNGLYYSKNFFRDERTYKSAARYLFPLQDSMELTADDYNKAQADLTLRLSSLGNTFKSMVGSSAPTVATTAGRAAAWHIPGMYEDKVHTLASVLEDLRKSFSHAWDMHITVGGETEATIDIKACPVREVCQKSGIELGGLLCDLYKSFLNGVVAELLKKRPMMKIVSTGPTQCQYQVKIMEVG